MPKQIVSQLIILALLALFVVACSVELNTDDPQSAGTSFEMSDQELLIEQVATAIVLIETPDGTGTGRLPSGGASWRASAWANEVVALEGGFGAAVPCRSSVLVQDLCFAALSTRVQFANENYAGVRSWKGWCS